MPDGFHEPAFLQRGQRPSEGAYTRQDQPLRAGDAVSVDGLEAYRLAADGIERLVWVDGEVVAVLSSDALPFSELLRMAESASVQ